jgi:catechol 2,3-dioxygenase-like lactoylglutathione lyase family enzyme
MPAHAMNHFTLLTKQVAATEEFYGDVLGLKSGYRPPLSRPGLWLYAGDTPVLHVVEPVNMPADPDGVLDHMAFSATGLNEILSKLTQRGLHYDLRRQGETGAWQLFFHDLNGAKVELDFSKDEPDPGALRTD